MKNPLIQAMILIVLLFLDTIFMIVALFLGSLPLFYAGGAVLVILIIFSLMVIKAAKKIRKDTNEKEEEV